MENQEASAGVVHLRPLDETVDRSPIDSDQVFDGEPETGWKMLGTLPGLDVGIWEHSPGSSTDVEEDEVFVVIAGRADVVAADGESYEFETGDVGILRSGTATTWIVHETIRKVFITPS